MIDYPYIPRVYVFTNQKAHWLLRGFFTQFERYWPGQDVTVVSYGPRPFGLLPKKCEYHSIATDNYPKEKWTNGLIRWLKTLDNPHFILMLEDYWLCEPVNNYVVNELGKSMMYAEGYLRNKVLRMDLSADRKSKRQCKPTKSFPTKIEILYSPPHAPYQMSMQAAMWNRDVMLECLVPNESPWEAEVKGTERLKNRPDIYVYGSTNVPLVYDPVYRTHNKRFGYKKMSKQDRDRLQALGYEVRM